MDASTMTFLYFIIGMAFNAPLYKPPRPDTKQWWSNTMFCILIALWPVLFVGGAAILAVYVVGEFLPRSAVVRRAINKLEAWKGSDSEAKP